MNVELVRVVTADGVRLEGTLRRAESPESGPLPVDVMIFHHGIGGNFYNQTCVLKNPSAGCWRPSIDSSDGPERPEFGHLRGLSAMI